jgi:uncharacterized protein YjeT (DUF2065 family)
MTNDNLLPFSFPAVSRKKVTAAFAMTKRELSWFVAAILWFGVLVVLMGEGVTEADDGRFSGQLYNGRRGLFGLFCAGLRLAFLEGTASPPRRDLTLAAMRRGWFAASAFDAITGCAGEPQNHATNVE